MRAATAIAARDRRHQTLRGLGPAVAGDHFARGLAVQAAHQRFVRVGTAREHIDDGLEGERKIQALTRAVALACERPGAQRRLWRSRSGQGHGRLQRVRALQLGAPTSLGKGFEQFACAPWRDLSERVALREKIPQPFDLVELEGLELRKAHGPLRKSALRNRFLDDAGHAVVARIGGNFAKVVPMPLQGLPKPARSSHLHTVACP